MSKKWLLLFGVIVMVLYGCFGPMNRLPQVSLIYPENGSQVAVLASTKSVTLKSTATDPEGRALTFAVYLGTSQTNLSKIGEVNEPQYTLTDLTPGQTYYWKVVVSDGTNSVESPVWSFTVGENHSLIKVVDFTTGPATVGAKVEILQGSSVVISDLTNQDGHAEFYLPDGRYDIKITGEGKATSVIYNYDPELIPTMEALSRRAMTDNDKILDAEFKFYDYWTGEEIDITQPVTTDVLKIKITETKGECINIAYVGVNYVPSAVGNDVYVKTPATEMTLSPVVLRGFNGKIVPIHVVLYTFNDTRMDYIFYLDIQYEYTGSVNYVDPTGLFYIGWTSDVNVQYYSLPKSMKESLKKIIGVKDLESFLPEHQTSDTNMFLRLYWDYVVPTGLAGYNVYRSDDGGETWQYLGRSRSYTELEPNKFKFQFIDQGYDLKAGRQYIYKVTTLYRDGYETQGATVTVVPLDLFKVKLISPADNETNVSRTPTFIWKPVDWKDWTSTPHIGGDQIDDQDITFYYYGPWIYDQALSDQHIYCDYYSITNGPQQVSVPFDPYSDIYPWVRIYPDGSSEDQLEPLEKFKTYEWGLDLAAAYYETEDGFWISTTIDYGYDFDRWDNEADYFNRFTTGE